MKTISYMVAIILLIGCSNQTLNCAFTKTEFLRKDSNKVIGTKLSNGKIVEFSDKSDREERGYYTFYDNGNLKSYEYLINDSISNYHEEYDSLGHIVKIEGNPSVRNTAQVLEDESINIKMYFFSLNKTYKKINIITNNGRNFYVSLTDDSLYSNLKVASIILKNLKDGQNIKTYFNVQYRQKCTDLMKKFTDSVSLYYYLPHNR